MLKKNNLIWIVFYFLLLLIVLNIVSSLFALHLNIEESTLFKLLFLGTPVILLILHSLVTLSLFRAIIFISLAAFTGWIMEVWGLNSGTFFGGHYVYRMGQASILNVPLSVIFYWAVFIYTGYCIVNSFLYWTHRRKPSLYQKNLWLLPIIVLLDGWMVVAIDLFMDPLQVKSGSWIWLEGGPYFGVPIGNFIGWFIVTIIVTGIFRTFEYFFPGKVIKYDKSVYAIPVIGYGALAISFMLDSMRHQMQYLAIIGSMLMLPIIVFNIILFIKWKKKVNVELVSR